MSNKKIYESIGSSISDDWMERERRYEAKHSPWDLDDNASYLDEEHRRHCEAREVRRQHERECEVERPQSAARIRAAAVANNAQRTPVPARAAERAIIIFFTFMGLMIVMFMLSMFLRILANF